MGIHYGVELRFGVAFEEPTDQGWTFGTYDIRDAAARTLLIENGRKTPEEVAVLEDDSLSKALAATLGLEFPWYNNGSPLGRYILSLSSSVCLGEGEGQYLDADSLQVDLARLLTLEQAVKTLGLRVEQAPSWMLMSVAD